MTGKFSKSVIRSPAGFTLLEIVAALAIIITIGTMFAVNFAGQSAGEELRKPTVELQKMAMAANRQASAFRDELRITFFKDGFFLSRAPIFERHQAEERAVEGFVFPEEDAINLELRHLGNPKWIQPNGVEWLFEPAGLSEPLEVRLSSGRSFIEMRFNPLTAAVDEERSVYE